MKHYIIINKEALWPVNAKRKRKLENQDINMRLLTKTWLNDYPWLKLAVKSVLKLCQEPIDWTIVCDNGQKSQIGTVMAQAMQETGMPCSFKVYEVGEYWAEVNGVSGYYAQQWVKMNAHMVMGDDYFFNWDSDVIAVKKFDSNTFNGKSGRPIFWLSQFNHLIQHGDENVHRARMAVIREMIGVPEVSFEYMRCMPVPMNGSILRCGSTRQEWKKSLELIRNSRGGFSEFNIIGMFSHLYFPDCYEWRNAENQGPTYSGGWDQNGNCFQEHAFVSQGYSWGGVQGYLENFVNAL